MNPIAQQLTVWAVTGIVTALGGYMLGWWRGYRRRADAMQAGVRVLLLCKLEQMQREMVADDGIADNAAKRTCRVFRKDISRQITGFTPRNCCQGNRNFLLCRYGINQRCITNGVNIRQIRAQVWVGVDETAIV